ncbi:hypothetical protein U9M48_003967 [Paspalum notatum var. saurae]|uniref:Reverse transcriptase domain-containing protein n=1 Tax=Paspalum notatum var. saurae TaxID=547442 RepID=A0AAQ3PUM0_PASNO
MLFKASEANLICGLLANFRKGGDISLQYADDTLLFSSIDKNLLVNLKCILVWFERILGMSINFHKSEIVILNADPQTTLDISLLFCCTVGVLPLKYLGVPLHYEKLSRENVQLLVDKILKRIASWRGRLLSHAARLVLIKSCLSSIPVYLLSFIKFPKWAIKLINTQLANCLWNDMEGNRKFHLANWDMCAMCKEYGGLGVQNLKDLNVCLLGSWIKRYLSSDGKLWKELFDFKYRTKHPNILVARDLGGSQFFKSFVYAIKAAKMGFRWKIGDGKRVKFWEDNWLGTSSLATQFWNLYVLVNERSVTVSDPWDGENLKCIFRRIVSETLYNCWLEVVQLASTISLTQEEDCLVWQFNSSEIYSSQSLYKIVNFRGIHPIHYGDAVDDDMEADSKLDGVVPGGKKAGALLLLGEVERNHQEGNYPATKTFSLSILKIGGN